MNKCGKLISVAEMSDFERGTGMKRVVTMLLSLALFGVVLTATACRSSSFSESSRTGFALDTVVSITIYEAQGDVDGEVVLDTCFAEIQRLEKLFSATIAGSDISRINAAMGAPVVVAEETAELLQLSLQYAELSDGAFDITLRPVTTLWDFSGDPPSLPDKTLLAEAVSTVDYRHLTVSGTTVTLTEGALDLGGIAKGFIADRLRDVLLANGVTSALVDLGGNIVVIGDKQGDAWRIGVKDPLNAERLRAIISGKELSVVTSGVYERGFTLDGVRYHHLLSPETGMPVQNGLASVTIVCESSVQADALSTACFVLGESWAMALLSELDDVEALFIRIDGTVSATDGLVYTLQ